jgi:dihydroorotate dehydrogenase
MKYYNFIKPLVFKFQPETAHNLAISALKRNLIPSQKIYSDEILKSNLFGLDFLNPIGLAAGFDKNAEAVKNLSSQGFGFIEVGTITPKPQEGNPRPRIFRLEEDSAIINRLGFNNKGLEYFEQNLKQNYPNETGVILGANIGKNKDAANDETDYVTCLEAVYGLSDYITINISSPNTPNLREMQKREILEGFISSLVRKRNSLAKKNGNKKIPMLLKIAPDNKDAELENIADISLKNKIDGVIISNTTISRPALKSPYYSEAGGLSGKPLNKISTDSLKKFAKLTQGKVPIIGVGGVSNAEDAYNKIKNGASLVQIYSALIYSGFEMVSEVNENLSKLLQKDGFRNIKEAVGADL